MSHDTASLCVPRLQPLLLSACQGRNVGVLYGGSSWFGLFTEQGQKVLLTAVMVDQIHSLSTGWFHLLPKHVFFCCSRSLKELDGKPQISV